MWDMSYVKNVQATPIECLSLQFLLFLLQTATDRNTLCMKRQLNHSTFERSAVLVYKHCLKREIRHQRKPLKGTKH